MEINPLHVAGRTAVHPTDEANLSFLALEQQEEYPDFVDRFPEDCLYSRQLPRGDLSDGELSILTTAEAVRQARLRTTCDWVIAETWGGRTLDDVMEEACRPDFRATREGLAVNEILETIQAARGWSLPELLGALITEPADTYHGKADEYLSS
ncbi:MAG TPA: hypothetical protein VMX97_17165, partial [Hyphomicrobiaceae bacterium]|nr:hypothetical protein [Hyphomicrobiaceae bacterium]